MKKVCVCGKGGSGKSVISALMARVLAEEGYTVLAVDSDESNPGLYLMFGFDSAPMPLVDVRRGGAYIMREFEQERLSLDDIPSEYLVEDGGLKLLTVGKITEALQGCACTMGAIVKDLLGKLALKDNEVVVVDTEAGVEHFGRGLEKNIDTVLVVVEPSFESIALAERVKDLAGAIGKNQVWAILNKITSDGMEEIVREKLGKRYIKTIGTVHHDPLISEVCFQGKALGDSQAKEDVRGIVRLLLREPE